MVLKAYEQFVQSLFKPMHTDAEYFLHAAVGIAGEAGELLDAVKKHWVYNKPLDYSNVAEELGDALFYLQAAALKLGVSLEDLMCQNMEKLHKRYPQGYTDAAAIARVDKE